MKFRTLCIFSLSAVLALASETRAALSVSNGDFESNTTQTTYVNDWFSTLASPVGDWWAAVWAGPTVSPNGGPVLGLSYFNATQNWAYQSIGINDAGITNLTIRYDVGSFTDAGSMRDIGLIFSVYASDGSFAGADNSDIAGAAGVTLVDSSTVYSGLLSAGQMLTDQSVTLDVRAAGSELFLRIQNAVGSTGEPWGAVDNITLSATTNTPPPSASDPYTNALVQAEMFELDRVRLLDSRFKDIQELHRTGYLAWLAPDRLLFPYRSNAGLSTQGSTNLGGWDGEEGTSWGANACRGHMLGHYLSAASKMVAATGETNYLDKIDYILTELRLCQDALAVSEPLYGYLAALPSSRFDTLETNPSGALVPFYTVHKLFAGLVDVYTYCGDDLALDIAIDMSDYHSWRIDRLSASQIEAMFRTDNGNNEEWGGMNEALSEIYRLSHARGDSDAVRHLEFAQLFHRDWFINPLEANTDQLNGLHANTHVPQVVGFAHTAAMLNTNDAERARLYSAADNFWGMVTHNHSFVLGGNSYAEHFSTPGIETGSGGALLAWNTAETCNTYNMLKLTGELMQHRPSAAYADYYEHALYNHILASISPETGMATYFVSLDPGHFKTYGQPEGSCWCCTGSGLENPSVYGQYIYQHKDDALWVNLYIPSTLDWSEKGIALQLDTAYPRSDQIQLTVNCGAPVQARLNLRIPGWIAAPATVKVNGIIQGSAAAAETYAELDRTWNDGDIISLQLPMDLRLDRAMDDESQVSLFYGPVLLAGDLGTENMPANHQETVDQWDHQGVPRAVAPSLMASDADPLSAWVHPTSTALVFTADAALAGATNRAPVRLKPFYDTHHARYTVYWNLVAPKAFSTWNGGGASAVWSLADNWDVSPVTGYGLRFSGTGGASANDFAGGTLVNGLDFPVGAEPFMLSGNPVALQGDIINASSNGQIINLPLALQNGLPWYFDAAGADLTFGAALSGSGVLVKRGNHRLSLLSDASFAGSIHVAEGTLQVGDGGTAGSLGELPVTLATNTALILDRSDAFQLESSVTGDGMLYKRGGGTMALLSALNTGALHVESGTVQITSTIKQILAHRWSFNGNLNDSVGGVTAQVVNVGANNTTLDSTGITLSGGNRSASDYVQLGSGLLPKDGTAVSIELWAGPESFQAWSRIFDVGSSTSENLFMAWNQTSENNDRVEWTDDVQTRVDSSYAPLTDGTEYHIVCIIEPGAGSSGRTKVSWYVAPSDAVVLGTAKGVFETDNTLAALNDVNFWLGRSEYNDPTASARYNEVRFWDCALGTAELEQLHTLGPDALGGLENLTLEGSFSPQLELDIAAGASVQLGGTSQQVAALSGTSNAVLNLGTDGALLIGTDGDPSAVFAGTVSGTGRIEIDGTLRLAGHDALPPDLTLINNGLLDTIRWTGTLPVGFVNNGTVIDRSLVRVDLHVESPTNAVLQAPGYQGHSYQFQSSTNLTAGWENIGPSRIGQDGPLLQETPLVVNGTYYRLEVLP